MLLRSVLLLLLIGGLQAETQESEVSAMVGSDVQLSCVCPQSRSFDLNDLYVYWQLSDSNTAVAYCIRGNSSTGHQDNQYRNRAHMSLEGMKRGDFSLLLHNVTPQDEQKFDCLVFGKSLENILKVVVKLHVAANYSVPVVSSPGHPSADEKLTFTCTSKDGYPRPKVYWINKTDNSLLDESLQNHSVSLNARGLYDVVSVLRIPGTSHVNVGCCIENVLLHQNLTAAGQLGTAPGTFHDESGTGPGSPGSAHRKSSGTLYGVLAFLLVAVAVAAGWVCRSRCPPRTYTGAQAVTLECSLTDH